MRLGQKAASLLLGLAILQGAGCKKRETPPPKELLSLTPGQACKSFFRRVGSCAQSINELKADELGLDGGQRTVFLRKVNDRLRRSLEDLDLVCARFAKKARQQQADMDRCYRKRTCAAFATCFVKMADSEVHGPAGNRARTLQELRKRLRKINRLRSPGLGPRNGPMGTGAGHAMGSPATHPPMGLAPYPLPR